MKGFSLNEPTTETPEGIEYESVIVDECKLEEVLDVLQSCLKEDYIAKRKSTYLVYDDDKERPVFTVDVNYYK